MESLIDLISNYWILLVAIVILCKSDLTAWALLGLIIQLIAGYHKLPWAILLFGALIDYMMKESFPSDKKKNKIINDKDDPDYD